MQSKKLLIFKQRNIGTLFTWVKRLGIVRKVPGRDWVALSGLGNVLGMIGFKTYLCLAFFDEVKGSVPRRDFFLPPIGLASRVWTNGVLSIDFLGPFGSLRGLFGERL